MIKNNYIKCKNCQKIVTIFMDDKFLDKKIESLVCSDCQSKEFEIVDSDNIHNEKHVKTRLTDNRKLDKEKYMSSDYKAIRANIDRVYKERKGLFGKNKSKFMY